MAKPKPPEEMEPITVRLPRSTVAVIAGLAAASRNAKGLAMSRNEYCAAILAQAGHEGVTITERLIYDVSKPLSSISARLNEDSGEYATGQAPQPDSPGKQKKRA